MRSPPLCTVFCIVLMAGLAAQEYEVQLASAFKAGERYTYNLTSTVALDHEMRVDEQVAKAQHVGFTVTLAGELTVRAATDAGELREVALRVDACRVTDAVGITPGLAVGDTIQCVRDAGGKQRYTVNGKPAAPADGPLLEAVIGVKNEQMPNDQESFGPRKAVAVGEVWKINTEAAMKAFANMGAQNGAQMDGQFTLDKAEPYRGVPSLFVSGRMHASGIAMPLPPGLTITASTADFAGSAILPREGAQRARFQETNDMRFSLSAAGTVQNKAMSIRMVKSERNTKTWTLIVR